MPYNAGTVFLQVVPSFRGVQRAIAREANSLGASIGGPIDEGVQRGVREGAAKAAGPAGRKAGEDFTSGFQRIVQTRLSRALQSLPNIEVKATTRSADRQIAQLRRRLADLNDQRIGVDVDARTALSEIAAVAAALQRIGGQSRDIDVQVNAAQALAQLNAVEQEARRLDGNDIRINLNDNGSIRRTYERMREVGSESQRTTFAFRAFSLRASALMVVLPAIPPLLGAVAGGFLAISAAGVVAIPAIAGLVAGFSGIGDAVGALGDVQADAAKDSLASARTMRTATNSVRDAQLALARAREDAAQRSEDASRRVADAIRDLNDAERNAAERSADAQARVVEARERAAEMIEDAIDSQVRAERSLASAQRDAQRAQQDLVEARQQAAQDLLDLEERRRGGLLDERQAVLDLGEAQHSYNSAMAEPGVTATEREEASIALERARLALESIRRENRELAAEKRKADRDGVEGSERVQTAEERLTEALQSQRDAQEQLGESARAVDEARIEGAELVSEALQAQVDVARENSRAIADAELAVADARRQQQRSYADGQRSISDAQRNLTDAQLAYQDALVQTGELGSASMQALDEAMSKLGPAGQRFARFIHGLRDEFLGFRNALQGGMLPGVESAIGTLMNTYGPGFSTFLGTLGTALGGAFEYAAEVFTNPVWQEFFTTIADATPGLVQAFTEIGLNLATGFVAILEAFMPLGLQFVEWLVGASGSFADWAASLEDSSAFQDFVGWLEEMGPRLEALFSALGGALVNLAIAMAPVMEDIVDGLIAVLNWVANMDPMALNALVMGILGLAGAFQIMAGAVTLKSFWAAFGVGGLIGLAIGALVAAFVWAYQNVEWFRNGVNAAVRAVGDFFVWVWENLLQPTGRFFGNMWRGLMDFLGPIFEAIGGFFSDVGAVFRRIWDGWIWPVIDLFVHMGIWLWENLDKLWGFLGDAWRGLGRLMMWVYDNTIGRVFRLFENLVVWFTNTFDDELNQLRVLWRALSGALQLVYDEYIAPIFAGFKRLMDDVGEAFGEFTEWIGDKWDDLVELLKRPLRWIINTVINDGLIDGVFNKAAEFFGSDKMDRIPMPDGLKKGGYATGGIYPGYTPGRDVGYIGVSGGEAIMRPEWTRAMGADYVHEANRIARLYGPRGVRDFMGYFARGGVAKPIDGGYRHSGWGSYAGHSGIDYAAPTGTNVRAFMAGLVNAVKHLTYSYGRHVRISHDDGLESIYAHLNQTLVRTGDRVVAGTRIGTVGSTGNSTGPHLHFEIRANGGAVNPVPYLSGAKSIAGGGPLAGVAQWVSDMMAKPLAWVKDQMAGPLSKIKEKFGDNWFASEFLPSIPRKLFDAVAEKLDSIIGTASDTHYGDAGAGPVKALVRGMAARYGWHQGAQWRALEKLVQGESSWNPNATNPSSGAHGLFQFMPFLWAEYGGKKTNDPSEQARLGLQYIANRYGSPAQAYAKWLGRNPHWYSEGGVVPEDIAAQSPDAAPLLRDTGGPLPPGLSQVLNLTGKNEWALREDQLTYLRDYQSGGINITVPMMPTNSTPQDVASALEFHVRRHQHAGVYADMIGD